MAGGGGCPQKGYRIASQYASIIVISPEFSKHFHRFSNKVNMIRREIEESDITKDLALVIAATNIHNVNEMISGRANALNVPVCRRSTRSARLLYRLLSGGEM